MVDAALQRGTGLRRSVFEVFGRKLPGERRYGVVAGTGRILDELRAFRFGDAELAALEADRVVSAPTLEWLSNYRFDGDIAGYREGETYFPGSPILRVEAPFAVGVMLETLILSILNHDSAVATAASRMTSAAGDRPVAEMGSRRTAEWSAVAAARAAYIAGFSATSNLEAGRSYGIPTMGTAAHAFTLLHDSERDAFEAQVAALGTGTTLLVDTYDIPAGIRTAVEVAGTGLGAVRLDSGDLPTLVGEVRAQLDSLGAVDTKITVTNDLDEFGIAALQATPVDSYGVGTSVVTGSGSPAMGLVFKLVARENDEGEMIDVAKRSTGKASAGGQKVATRTLHDGTATSENVYIDREPADAADEHVLTVPLVRDGEVLSKASPAERVQDARKQHERSRRELPAQARRLRAGEPAIPTRYIHA